ncbi:Pirin [Cricetulus griseus]|uniref:Pirin n=1 Tax=Cricetulus griseus TaxID=10029 RepID=G3HH92_CRIGR|nr:Pirin [Cricetulus griseus]
MRKVSYLLEGGSMAHEDFCGHVGKMNPGDLQWMTAGRGILHAEMPCSEEPAHGLQLWVNLRSSEKMVEPQYQELKNDEIPKPTKDGVTVAVISGEALGVKGQLRLSEHSDQSGGSEEVDGNSDNTVVAATKDPELLKLGDPEKAHQVSSHSVHTTKKDTDKLPRAAYVVDNRLEILTR